MPTPSAVRSMPRAINNAMNTHGSSLQSLQRISLICASKAKVAKILLHTPFKRNEWASSANAISYAISRANKETSVVSPLQLKLVMLAMQMRSNMQSVRLYSEMQEKTPNLGKNCATVTSLINAQAIISAANANAGSFMLWICMQSRDK